MPRFDLRDIQGNVRYVEDPYQAAAESDAIALITEWPQYASLDFERIFQSMVQPAFIFDGRNILDHQKLYEIGFNVFPIGKPALTHFHDEPDMSMCAPLPR